MFTTFGSPCPFRPILHTLFRLNALLFSILLLLVFFFRILKRLKKVKVTVIFLALCIMLLTYFFSLLSSVNTFFIFSCSLQHVLRDVPALAGMLRYPRQGVGDSWRLVPPGGSHARRPRAGQSGSNEVVGVFAQTATAERAKQHLFCLFFIDKFQWRTYTISC